MKSVILKVLRALGVFALARRITRSGLRILCYHAVSIADEHVFNPTLFMRESVFRRRLETLKRLGYPVISLDQAATGRYPPNAVVLTIDDGWVSTLTRQAPLLKQLGLPATVYVCSYYCENQSPVFNVYARYLFSRKLEPFDLPEFSFYWRSSGNSKDGALDELLVLGESLSFEQRNRLALALSQATGIHCGDQFSYMTLENLRELQNFGLDLQLHTHRHIFPASDSQIMRREILDNRTVCRQVTDGALWHFCYPSGEWTPECFAVLEELGVRTATTCDNRLSYRDTPPLAMGRFVDSDITSEIVFEAELSGLLDIARNPRRYLRWQALRAFTAPDTSRVRPGRLSGSNV